MELQGLRWVALGLWVAPNLLDGLQFSQTCSHYFCNVRVFRGRGTAQESVGLRMKIIHSGFSVKIKAGLTKRFLIIYYGVPETAAELIS